LSIDSTVKIKKIVLEVWRKEKREEKVTSLRNFIFGKYFCKKGKELIFIDCLKNGI
jgi:hypothetical protein